LHDNRLDLSGVVRTSLRFFGVAEQRIRRDHLRDGQARTKTLTELPERPIRHAGHRRDD